MTIFEFFFKILDSSKVNSSTRSRRICKPCERKKFGLLQIEGRSARWLWRAHLLFVSIDFNNSDVRLIEPWWMSGLTHARKDPLDVPFDKYFWSRPRRLGIDAHRCRNGCGGWAKAEGHGMVAWAKWHRRLLYAPRGIIRYIPGIESELGVLKLVSPHENILYYSNSI